MNINEAVKTAESNVERDKALALTFRNDAKTRTLSQDERAILADLEARIERNKSLADGLRETKRQMAAEDAAMGDNIPTRAAFTRTSGRRHTSASIGYEARTYRPDRDPKGVGFLSDVTASFLGNSPAASERLARHQHEEAIERPEYAARATGDVGTANFGGLVVPQYLTDMVAHQVSNLRSFSDACTVKHDLDSQGMSVNISRVTTGSSVTNQPAEFTTLASANLDDTLLTIAVQTAGGFLTLSRQAIDRGIGIEDTSMLDLARKYAANLDATVMNQATTGMTNVAVATTYTSATPTAAEFWPYISQAQSKLEAALVGVASPTHCVMHSRRWNWLASQVGSSWPFVGGAGVASQNGAMQLTTEYGPSVRAVLANGLKVVVDNNIATNLGGGTNQDEVFVVSADESCHLWEDPSAPMYIRGESADAQRLGVLLVIYGYYAYSAQRYTGAVQKISGTGLVGPAGF